MLGGYAARFHAGCPRARPSSTACRHGGPITGRAVFTVLPAAHGSVPPQPQSGRDKPDDRSTALGLTSGVGPNRGIG
jgi:hypothetical protein